MGLFGKPKYNIEDPAVTEEWERDKRRGDKRQRQYEREQWRDELRGLIDQGINEPGDPQILALIEALEEHEQVVVAVDMLGRRVAGIVQLLESFQKDIERLRNEIAEIG